MTVRFAFAGFRHGHIFGLLNAVRNAGDAALVAACEEDAATRAQLEGGDKVTITHTNVDAMLADTACDVVAIGDYYGRRGELAIRALKAGKHVILDKPICTSLEELATIEKLARAGGLAVGCQLDMRASARVATLRALIREGTIGEVQTVCFSGQHPLLSGSRPPWYFEPGKQGGTINDIAIHAMDWIPWVTGREIVAVVAARTWNAKARSTPCFKDCAQLMLRLDNGGGVLGDVSYLAPDGCGYQVRQYWRITVHGTRGVVESGPADEAVMLATDADKAPRAVAAAGSVADGYFRDFMLEVTGQSEKAQLNTALVIRAARLALTAQKSADEGLFDVPC